MTTDRPPSPDGAAEMPSIPDSSMLEENEHDHECDELETGATCDEYGYDASLYDNDSECSEIDPRRRWAREANEIMREEEMEREAELFAEETRSSIRESERSFLIRQGNGWQLVTKTPDTESALWVDVTEVSLMETKRLHDVVFHLNAEELNRVQAIVSGLEEKGTFFLCANKSRTHRCPQLG